MNGLEVTNPNIFVDLTRTSLSAGTKRRRRNADDSIQFIGNVQLLRQLDQFRGEIEKLVCSAAWNDDCLYRGADYAPDFQCSCPHCRTFFPNRRDPRGARESKYSIDCQIQSDDDPELAQDLARLRNDRVRIGSVFLRIQPKDRGASL